jgi:hypothetical protein
METKITISESEKSVGYENPVNVQYHVEHQLYRSYMLQHIINEIYVM